MRPSRAGEFQSRKGKMRGCSEGTAMMSSSLSAGGSRGRHKWRVRPSSCAGNSERGKEGRKAVKSSAALLPPIPSAAAAAAAVVCGFSLAFVCGPISCAMNVWLLAHVVRSAGGRGRERGDRKKGPK